MLRVFGIMAAASILTVSVVTLTEVAKAQPGTTVSPDCGNDIPLLAI